MPLKGYNSYSDPQLLRVKIGDHIFNLEVALDHEKGLSGTYTLDHDGMIFLFDSDSPVAFHMKDCKFSLDILFCKDGLVQKIAKECIPCHLKNCPKYTHDSVECVIELPGGLCSYAEIYEGDSYEIL